MEKNGGEPLLRLSLFKNIGFSLGLIALGILVIGQFGSFFIFPLYYQNVLGLTAFQTGLVFLWTSITIAIVGPLSGVLASKFGPKWIVVSGMLSSLVAFYWLSSLLSTTLNLWSLVPGLVLLGIGIGLASSQVTNIILSQVPQQFLGEASAVNATIRQVGASVGTALIGTVLAANLSANIVHNVQADNVFPPVMRQQLAQSIKNMNAESGTQSLRKKIPNEPVCSNEAIYCISSHQVFLSVKQDVDQGLVDAAKSSLHVGLIFIAIGLFFSLFIPATKLTVIPKGKEKERE